MQERMAGNVFHINRGDRPSTVSKRCTRPNSKESTLHVTVETDV